MKGLTNAVFSLALLCLLPFAKGEFDRFNIAIEERGARFTEDIYVDEEKNVVVYRVPAHNDINGAHFYHDFKMRVTVTRIISRKVCHIAKMDASLSSPRKLKEDLQRAASQLGKLPVTTKRHLTKVGEPADRRLLPKEMLHFCGTFPIYNMEVYSTDSVVFDHENETAIIQRGRQKRQTGDIRVEKFISCLRLEKKNSMTHVETCMNSTHWNLSCRMTRGDCYYEVVCEKLPTRLDWTCREVHLQYSNPACCDFICP